LRPLRTEKEHQRVVQLQRAVQRGAVLVVSSRAASHEVIAAMGLERPEIVVVRPPVGHVDLTRDGRDLVVSVTGNTERFEALAKDLESFVRRHQTSLFVIASTAVLARLRASTVRGFPPSPSLRSRLACRPWRAPTRSIVNCSMARPS
jgi:hypothetical protein